MRCRGEVHAVEPELRHVHDTVKAQEDERVAATSRVPVSGKAEVLAIPEHGPRPVPVALVACDVAKRVVQGHQPVVGRIDDRPCAVLREVSGGKRVGRLQWRRRRAQCTLSLGGRSRHAACVYASVEARRPRRHNLYPSETCKVGDVSTKTAHKGINATSSHCAL